MTFLKLNPIKKMKKNCSIITVFVLSFSIFLSSCNKTNNENIESTENDSVVIVEEIVDKKDYTIYNFDQKEVVASDAKKELSKMKGETDRVKKEYETVKANYESAIEKLEEAHKNFSAQLDTFNRAKSEFWGTAKNDLTKSYAKSFELLQTAKSLIEKTSSKNDTVETTKN